MDSRQLHHFRTIVDTGSFTAAAEKLLMAQPSLSTTVKNLEKELGTPLLVRTRSGVILTESGQEIYRLAVQVLDHMEFSAARVRGLASGEVGRVVISVAPTVNWEFIPRLVRQLRAESPGIDLVLEDPDPSTTLAHVKSGQTDLGVVPTSDVRGLQALHPDLEVELLTRVDLVLALPEEMNSQVVQDGAIHLRDVSHLDWYIPRIHQGVPGLPEALEAFWRRHPATHPQRIHTVATIQTALPLVAGGAGVTLVPRSLSALLRGPFTYRDVADPIDPLILAVLRNSTRYQSPVVERVREKLVDMVSDGGEGGFPEA